jgi:NAD(P)H-dependent flavin oxidoreductase YrpB (nitropropane dioxygenase family)
LAGVGTRFVAAIAASAPKKHKELICRAGFEDAFTMLIFTGRTPYIEDWNLNR